MKKIVLHIFLAMVCISCNNNPQEYFSQAALNCNLLYGFAGNEFQRTLAQPAEKLVDAATMKTAPMKRGEVVQQKLEQLEQNFAKLQALGNDKDAAAMVTAAKELYNWVLPVYKTEYKALAALYDAGAAREKIAAMEQQIQEKYEPRFLQLYQAMWTEGKAYAERNGIRVQEVNPSPVH